ncbi:magnesium-transporting ATPase (P-type) [Geomicrobium sediminis]|uniref:Magnesium-transporting ATPase (P-type) n=2 Tax=Geomicrobium sediminis TaxID=1347788 RepID=A0ABS2P956_9BACL|nr:magnesium-transporting ATPase (P-type) [Geomicrobium sediminis]
MKQVWQLAWFEMRHISVLSIILFSILVPVVGVSISVLQEDLPIGFDVIFLLMIVFYSAIMTLSNSSYKTNEQTGLIQTSLYRYTRRLPILERKLFYSRVVANIARVMILAVLLFSVIVWFTNNRQLDFGTLQHVAFVLIWFSIALSSIAIVLNEGSEKSFQKYYKGTWKKGYVQQFVFLIAYGLVQLIVYSFTGTTVSSLQATATFASSEPFLAIGFATLFSTLIIVIVLKCGVRELRKRGVDE